MVRPVVDMEVVLHGPALGDLQMPAVCLSVADSRHDACRLSDVIGCSTSEARLDKFVASALWRLDIGTPQPPAWCLT